MQHVLKKSEGKIMANETQDPRALLAKMEAEEKSAREKADKRDPLRGCPIFCVNGVKGH
jgi:hypothetical protein